MYNNIGRKIKMLATIVFIIGCVGSAIAGISLISAYESILSFGGLIIILGPLASWISTCLLYGFGQLIENSDIIANKCTDLKSNPEKHDKDNEFWHQTFNNDESHNCQADSQIKNCKTPIKNTVTNKFNCPTCEKAIDFGVASCECGQLLDWSDLI